MNSGIPQISVIMPVYNGGRYLREAVDSILNQTFREFEFIIIDDGSTDDTWSVLTDYAAHDSRVRLIQNEANIGLTRSLNKGLAVARAALIARQDADDISMPERLARQIAFLEMHPEVGLLGTQGDFIDADGRPIEDRRWRFAHDNSILQKQILDYCPFFHGSVVIRRSFLDRVGPYDVLAEPAEDYDLWLRLAEVTHLANLETVQYQYRFHPASVGHTRRRQQLFQEARVLEAGAHRRFGRSLTANQWEPVACAYLRVALFDWAISDTKAARQMLEQAISTPSNLFDTDQVLERLLSRALELYPIGDQAHYYESVFFDLLHDTRIPLNLRSALASRLHMRQVFSGVEVGNWEQVRRHFWLGVRHNPRWLLNRGVLVIGLKASWSKHTGLGPNSGGGN